MHLAVAWSFFEGIFDGRREREGEGLTDGETIGTAVGLNVGVGLAEGFMDGRLEEGSFEGKTVGSLIGSLEDGFRVEGLAEEGLRVGKAVGRTDGRRVNIADGPVVRVELGSNVGFVEEFMVVRTVGSDDGTFDGKLVLGRRDGRIDGDDEGENVGNLMLGREEGEKLDGVDGTMLGLAVPVGAKNGEFVGIVLTSEGAENEGCAVGDEEGDAVRGVLA